MKFQLLVIVLFPYFLLPVTGQTNSDTVEKPNIIIIMADDLGYSDLGCFGGEIQTPHLDALAEEGIRFSNFYNTARCCPTRAALLTGQYQHKVGLAKNGQSLNRKGITIAEVLKENDYQTGMVGKWHLTKAQTIPDKNEHLKWLNHQAYLDKDFGAIETYPTRRGFDKYYGVIWGVIDFFDPFSLVEGEKPVQKVPKDYYATDAFSAKAVEYIQQFSQQEEPFFLYVAYTAPHWPIHALPEDIKKYQDQYSKGWKVLQQQRYQRQIEMGLVDPNTHPLSALEGPNWKELSSEEQAFEAKKMAVHAAMVDRLDQGIGAIINSLKNTKQFDNTFILFLSDNGASPEIPKVPGYDRNGATREGQAVHYAPQISLEELGSQSSYTGIGPAWANASNTPYRYWKAESYGGGVRSPAIIYWKGLKTCKGQINKDLVHVMDVMPTSLDLSQSDYPQEYKGNKIGQLDGHSLLSILNNQSRYAYEALFFEHESGKAMIKEDWKIASMRRKNTWELYNLKTDATESTDLSLKHPELLHALKAQWKKWYAEVIKGTEVANKLQNAQFDEAKPAAYLFAHMTKEDYGHLYYAVSEDGLNWQLLNEGKPVHDQYRGHPDIMMGHDGRYYMIGVEEEHQDLILWVSNNLINWREQKKLPKAIFDGTQTPGYKGNPSWYGAPKMFYDLDTEQYLISWHAPDQTIPRKDAANYWCSMRTFYVRTKNFESFTAPKKLFPYDMGTIDVIIRKEGDLYYAFLKDECEASALWPTGKSIRVAVSQHLEGPYAYPGASISPNYHEAPTIIPKKDRSGYYLYYEMYTGQRYTVSEAQTLAGPWWNTYQMKYNIPSNARHGCMWPLTSDQYKSMLNRFNRK